MPLPEHDIERLLQASKERSGQIVRRRRTLTGAGVVVAALLIVIPVAAWSRTVGTSLVVEPGATAPVRSTGSGTATTDPTDPAVTAPTSPSTTLAAPTSTTTTPPGPRTTTTTVPAAPALPRGFYTGTLSGIDRGRRTVLLTISFSCGTPSSGTWLVDVGTAAFTYNATPMSRANELTFDQWVAFADDPTMTWEVLVREDRTAIMYNTPNSGCGEMRPADR